MSRPVYGCCECNYKHYDATKVSKHLVRAHGYPKEDSETSVTQVTIDRTGDTFELQEYELAGFQVCGWKAQNTIIEIACSKRLIKQWPEEILLNGSTFTLETITDGAYDDKGRIYQEAEYV